MGAVVLVTLQPHLPAVFFFFNDPATPEISPLPQHDALPIWMDARGGRRPGGVVPPWSGDLWGEVNDEALNAKLGSFLFGIPKPGDTAESVCAAINRREIGRAHV